MDPEADVDLSPQDSDYDGAWKEAPRLHLPDFLAKFFAAVHAAIDWMMHLRSDWERRFRADLAAYEEQAHMPYITSVERLAKAEGRAEGGVGVLLSQLGRVCGPLPQDVEQRIRCLSYPEIETLSEAVLDFRTLDHVRKWLDAHAAKSTGE